MTARPAELLYLAYGSNLHPGRLQQRVPSARAVGTVALAGWVLRWTKRGADGSAKCTVEAGARDSVVHGAVFAIAAGERGRLDRAEGPGYAARPVRIPGHGRVFFYVARPHYVEEGLQPYCWYRDYVVCGARYHGFPAAYVDWLRDTTCRDDPQRARAEGHARLIARLAGGGPARHHSGST